MELKITLPDEVGLRIAARAAECDLTPEAWLEETVLHALGTGSPLPGMTREEFEAYVAEGEADVAAGRVVSWEEAMQDVRDIIETAKRRRG